ncbi:MAG TPA: J domain-containing protein [Spirochaetia bacterium]|nr:J domain-containing protein [Spirochaetia bacterium]
MDGFIDRLADLLKTLWGTGSDSGSSSARGSESRPRNFIDPDVQAAWEELDEYIRTGSSGGEGAGARPSGSSGARTPPSPNESLRQDYANLEVAFGADIDTVRSSYKKLMLKYHPDRFGGDPEKQKIALEIAKKINQSFQRIRDQQEGPSS